MVVFLACCAGLFAFAAPIARWLGAFYSRYSLTRLLPAWQLRLRPTWLRIAALVLVTSVVAAWWWQRYAS